MTGRPPGGHCPECGHALALHGVGCGIGNGYVLDVLIPPCPCRAEGPMGCSTSYLPIDICYCPQHRSGERLPDGRHMGHSFEAQFRGTCSYCGHNFSAGAEIAAIEGFGYAHARREDCRFSSPFIVRWNGRCVLCGDGFSRGETVIHYIYGGCVHAGELDCRNLAPEFTALPLDCPNVVPDH